MDEEFINRTDGDLPGTMNDSLKGLGQVPQLRPLEPTKQKFNNVTLKFRKKSLSRNPGRLVSIAPAENLLLKLLLRCRHWLRPFETATRTKLGDIRDLSRREARMGMARHLPL
ncbi:hypothetical protein FOIG_00845 [Fusarium odoratissimum NRRL 54006]|uniref:Uncharacterized protein n=2 Tax=Fusarium oxysporum species complex TaxID=171631 RepID=X0KBK6_FUSO5|nr:uncharacterized protein FOIG_00845 [Fusarium odoratissimum NRRL 54006]EXM10979.1 hypothetical protein FOIG_00845 [Fusarium odoratissimum NRRL 54006]TXC04209.1 hypothetical protein FocTR4_00001308 [Fusarium oxysporum f. sp. cubense]